MMMIFHHVICCPARICTISGPADEPSNNIQRKRRKKKNGHVDLNSFFFFLSCSYYSCVCVFASSGRHGLVIMACKGGNQREVAKESSA
jgi:hypothetical protein